MNNKIFIKNRTDNIEAKLDIRSNNAIIICHPHPLYGGTMDNKVVTALQKSFFQKDFTTLIFNFRGVGESDGSFDGGKGELEDLVCVKDYLFQKVDVNNFYLAGFSFGSYIASRFVLKDNDCSHLILVAPPLQLYNFDHILNYEKPKLILIGDNDEFCRIGQINELYEKLSEPKKLIVFKDTDHLFTGKYAELKKTISNLHF